MSGTLYDTEAPISGAKIMNMTSKSITSTDGTGHFEIYAKLHDTLVFSSLFHHTKQLVITKAHLEESQVVELKKILNELDEVDLKGPISVKEMNEKEETSRVNKQFKTDVEKNPHLYRRPNANSGPIDFMEIGRRVAKLFKRKTPKEEKMVETSLTAAHLDTLFKTDPFFNDTFLVLDLNITKDYKHLFFTYCETKDLSSFLLLPDNKIYLIDTFLEYSKDFRGILEASQK
ncbi:carboxypeptidase-like regulatory domain-containing protein [Gelidibacter salicanalis]|uniref:Carboxypeptidase-like regulatory domain-containing protein n=2 Tax=Gelidibacter salicanalis TaxID=291193 RepID=A0A934NHZ7_9FLAO|nr:carboxypeptidase-like regulatory domain-containing protein [Gelidibacter salicanalis]